MRSSSFRIAAVVVTLLLPLLSADARAQSCLTMAGNLVLNCSFENPMPTGNGVVYPFAPVDHWLSTGNESTGIFERWTFYDGFAARDGGSHLELNVNSPTSIYQSLATVAGQQYTVGFSAANRPGSGFSLINVYMNNVLFFSTGQIVAPYQWQDFSTSFVASGATTVRFEGAGNGGSYGDFIDNVSVASVVPEPATLAMLGVGFVGLVVVGRHRRR